MFEAISLEDNDSGGESINPGFLAECLIFYKKVVVSGNRLVLESLFRTVGPSNLLELLKSRTLEFHFKEEQSGISTGKDQLGREHHALIKMSSPDHTLEKDVAQACANAIAQEPEFAKRCAEFSSLVLTADLRHFDLNVVAQCLAESAYVQRSVEAIIAAYAPRYLLSAKPRFRVHQDSRGLIVETNLDFKRLNREYHRVVPASRSSLSPAHFLMKITGAQESLALAGHLGSELGESAVGTAIHNLHLSEIIQRRAHSGDQIGAISDLTLDGAFAIRDAINRGDVTFRQVLELLDRAERFKNWLHDQTPDRELIKAYYAEVVRESWVDRLPAKSMRWGIFTGAGLAVDVLTGGIGGTLGGIGLSVVDSFLLDKLIRGWRPHHFIEEELKPMIRASDSQSQSGSSGQA